jgi:hypothetical protein
VRFSGNPAAISVELAGALGPPAVEPFQQLAGRCFMMQRLVSNRVVFWRGYPLDVKSRLLLVWEPSC